MKRISIPYGAIKSNQKLAIYEDLNRFQFLMVRLKDIYHTAMAYNFHISIPYGAIKSTTRFLLNVEKVIFQFLMVRLKG